jgi:hypothetical protein
MHLGKDVIKNILVRPDLFFRQATESRPDLFCPFLLVALGSLIMCVGYVSLIFPTILYGDIPNLLFLVLGTYPLIVFCAWLGWLALSVLLFAGSAAFKGTGPFTMTLQNTGYGTAFCLLISGLIQIAGSVVNAVYLSMTGGINFGMYMAGQPQMLLVAVFCASLILPVAWGALLWGHGLANARKMPLTRALTVATVIAAACLVLMYGPFLAPLTTASR